MLQQLEPYFDSSDLAQQGEWHSVSAAYGCTSIGGPAWCTDVSYMRGASGRSDLSRELSLYFVPRQGLHGLPGLRDQLRLGNSGRDTQSKQSLDHAICAMFFKSADFAVHIYQCLSTTDYRCNA